MATKTVKFNTKLMSERETLIAVRQFLQYPPQLGNCFQVNANAWQNILNLVHGCIEKYESEEKSPPTTAIDEEDEG